MGAVFFFPRPFLRPSLGPMRGDVFGKVDGEEKAILPWAGWEEEGRRCGGGRKRRNNAQSSLSRNYQTVSLSLSSFLLAEPGRPGQKVGKLGGPRAEAHGRSFVPANVGP